MIGVIAFSLFVGIFVVSPLVSASSDSLTPHDPIRIIGNADFSDGDADGVINPAAAGSESDPYIIENWIIDASDEHGIWIEYTDVHFAIRNCVIENGFLDNNNGIYLENVEYGVVENTFSENNEYGFALKNSSNNLLKNNLTENNNWKGFFLWSDSNNNILRNNWAKNNPNYGFYLASSSSTVLENNQVGNNGGGIILDGSSNNVLKKNLVENNLEGITLIGSSNNVLKKNLVENNRYGFYLPYYHLSGFGDISSNNNLIFRNQIIHNNTQAFDNCSNYWDYYGVGNYWSDWQPPEHPDTNNDGIVDEPRPIDGENNYDNYPLVIPVEVENVMLQEGWNLFSLPLQLENSVAENVFAELSEFPTIYGWSNGYYMVELEDKLKVGEGYWVHVSEAENISVKGQPLDNFTLQLNAGWNLSGIPSNIAPIIPRQVFETVPTIYGWSNGYYIVLSDDNFEPGQGYWIHSEQAKNVQIP